MVFFFNTIQFGSYKDIQFVQLDNLGVICYFADPYEVLVCV